MKPRRGGRCQALDRRRYAGNVSKRDGRRCSQPVRSFYQGTEQEKRPRMGSVLLAVGLCRWRGRGQGQQAGSGAEGAGLTCHYRAHQEKDAEEYVPRQRAEPVHDLPLADGEEDSKHLSEVGDSQKLLAILANSQGLGPTCAEQLRSPEEVPSDSGYVSSTANSKPRGR